MVLQIFKMIATSGFLTAVEFSYTKFVFGRGFAPDPSGGAYSASPDSLAGLRRPTSKAEGEGEGREQKGWPHPLTQIPGSAPVVQYVEIVFCSSVCAFDQLQTRTVSWRCTKF